MKTPAIDIPELGRLQLGPQTAKDLKAWRQQRSLTQVQCGLICGLAVHRNKRNMQCRHWAAMEAGERPIPDYVGIILAYATAYGYPPIRQEKTRRKGGAKTHVSSDSA